jgi:hypothetical protein
MAGRNNTKNDEYAKLDRRKRAASLYLQGLPQWQIARDLGIAQGTVSKDLAIIREEWKASALTDFDEKKARELAKIDHIEEVAWAAWERSCEDAEVRHSKTEQVPGGAGVMAPIKVVEETTAKGQSGNPAFLERVSWCVEARLKILGLLKSDKLDVNAVVNLPPDFWDRIAARPVTTTADAIEQRIAHVGKNGTNGAH